MQNKTAALTPAQIAIIQNKATEYPFSGEYNDLEAPGTYLCRQCGLALFRADAKFHSGCGWPAFDAAVADHVKTLPDADGRRTEILCSRCEAHLGHVFSGEGFTPNNTRHCVNSISLDFVKDLHVMDTEEAILAAGCFWGVEYYLKRLTGVVKTEVGYIGGHLQNPDYAAVCSGESGHYEAVRVVYDKAKLSYAQLIRFFFEIHNPTQTDGQGPDLGEQYLSAIFYYDEKQKQLAQQVMAILTEQGLKIATALKPVSSFWPAERYHQDYYTKQQKQPYCHFYTKRF